MKEIKVIVKDKTILELDEDAKKGDFIDLNNLTSVDLKSLELAIDLGKDKISKEKIENGILAAKKDNEIEILNIKKEYESKIQLLESNLKNKDQEIDNQLKIKEVEIDKKYLQQIETFKSQIKSLEKDLNDLQIKQVNELKVQESNLKLDNLKEIDGLKNKITTLEAELKLNEISKENAVKEAVYNQKSLDKIEIDQWKDKYNTLTYEKSNLSVKVIGEALEGYCNNKVHEVMQCGFLNCKWEKDNEAIRFEEEGKGTKADYIFTIFADETKNDNEVLAKLCLEMKSENPTSVIKKKNSDHFEKLDKDRIKKNCKYAILVSELEMDKPEDLPISKVNEYPDMYIVRPAYLISFLNMIVALHNGFAKYLKEEHLIKIEYQKQEQFVSEFEELKEKYLNKPLNLLENEVDAITKQSSAIITSANKINESAQKIKDSYILEITNKLIKFEGGVAKEYRKLNK